MGAIHSTKIPTGLTGKGGPPQKVDQFFSELLGRFPFNPISGNFGWYIKWNGPFRFGPTAIFGTSFEGGPL